MLALYERIKLTPQTAHSRGAVDESQVRHDVIPDRAFVLAFAVTFSAAGRREHHIIPGRAQAGVALPLGRVVAVARRRLRASYAHQAKFVNVSRAARRQDVLLLPGYDAVSLKPLQCAAER